MALTLQHILNHYPFEAQTDYNNSVLAQLKSCRTKQLGYHLYKCSDEQCGTFKYQYHSCRNRHCPQCGALQKKQWVEDRQRELLPVPYYHMVFTMPHELNAVTLGNRSTMFSLLFKAASSTLLNFAADGQYLGAKPGIIAVLHTWGQQLSFHPHLHCIVSAGGIVKKVTVDGSSTLYWKEAKTKRDHFLFPVKAMSEVYRGIFLKELKQLISAGKIALTAAQQNTVKTMISSLYQKQWVVYAKKPFGGPQQVLQYLAAYTHKVAITNQRIIQCSDDAIQFAYKDYRDGSKQKKILMAPAEFLRRFEQHILPGGFTKIRTYGYLANRGRTDTINAITASLKLPPHPPAVKIPWYIRLYEAFGIKYNECPCCKKLSLVLVLASCKQTIVPDST